MICMHVFSGRILLDDATDAAGRRGPREMPVGPSVKALPEVIGHVDCLFAPR